MGTLLDDQYTSLIISRSFLLRMKIISDKSCRETQNAYLMFSNLKKKFSVYEICGKML